MTVLKRDDRSAARVARFPGAPVIALPAADPLAEEVAALRRDVVALHDELATAGVEAEAARLEAWAQGQAQGREEAERRAAEHAALLRDGVATALAALDDRLAGERDMAVEIAKAALTAMVGDASSRRELVIATTARHAATLAHGSIVQLNVSAADFPDEAALAAIEGIDHRLRVVIDPSLASGGCRFDLTLGALDASIDGQLAAVVSLLDGAAA